MGGGNLLQEAVAWLEATLDKKRTKLPTFLEVGWNLFSLSCLELLCGVGYVAWHRPPLGSLYILAFSFYVLSFVWWIGRGYSVI